MASGNIRLEIVTPEKSVVSEDAQIVMAPGTLGEFGVLIGHTPFMSTLKMGIIRYVDANAKERFVFILFDKIARVFSEQFRTVYSLVFGGRRVSLSHGWDAVAFVSPVIDSRIGKAVELIEASLQRQVSM